MALYTCVHHPLADVIMEGSPEYKTFDVYAYSNALPGYVWVGKVYQIYDEYPLEDVDMVDEDEGVIYFMKMLEEL